METPTQIDLSSETLVTDDIAITEQFATVLVEFAGVDGDFDVIPRQTLDGENYDLIYDMNDKPIIWPVRPIHRGNKYKSGTRTFNLPAELYAVNLQLECRPVSGNTGCTVGTVDFTVKNTASES